MDISIVLRLKSRTDINRSSVREFMREVDGLINIDCRYYSLSRTKILVVFAKMSSLNKSTDMYFCFTYF